MADTKYTKSYSILGVFQDDGWEKVRSAYRQQIKRWHPDRLQDSSHRKIAEEKSKEINQAYQNLADYYREFGVLPPDHTSEQVVASTTHEKWTGPDRHDRPETSHASFEESPQPRRRNYLFKTILAGIVIAVVYAFYEPSILDPHGTDEMIMSGNPGHGLANGRFTTSQDGRNNAGDPGALPKAVIPDNTTSADTNNSTNYRQDTIYDLDSRANTIQKNTQASSASRKSVFDSHPSSPVRSVRPAFITKGASKSEVLALQGPPLRQTETEWDYGLSRIYFQNGKVIDWYENPMNPLMLAR